MKRRFIFIMLILIIFTINLVGCRNNDVITLNLKVPFLTLNGSVIKDDVESGYDLLMKITKSFIEKYSNKYNLNINVSQYENELEYGVIDAAYGTDNACDILFDDYFTMRSQVYLGRVISLDDIISIELKNDIYSRFWDSSRINDKIYMMPYLYRQNVLMYNIDLFNKAGLNKYVNELAISSWTLEEWDYILRSLRESMDELSYPMMMYALSNQEDTHIMSLLRSRGASFLDSNGRFNLESSEGLSGLRWIRDCINNRYMPEYADELDILDNYSLFKNNQLGIFICNAIFEKEFSNYGLVNFPSVEGGKQNF